MPDFDALVRYFETLTPDAVARMGEHYADDAWFKDPFNEVRGLPAIQHIFAHMFEQLDAPRFVITERIVQEHGAMLAWDFHLTVRGQPLKIRGVSHVRWNAAGKINYHRDYWDAAEELYAKLPVLGGLMRLLQRRLAA